MKYPLDYTQVVKGQSFSAEQLTEILGIQPTEITRYKLSILAFKAELEKQAGVLCKTEGNALRVLTDTEADVWTITQSGRHVQGLGRNARRRVLIDRSGMSADEQRIAESRDRIAVGVASLAMAEFRRQIQIENLSKQVAEIEDKDKE
jgi:hypothetical protein